MISLPPDHTRLVATSSATTAGASLVLRALFVSLPASRKACSHADILFCSIHNTILDLFALFEFLGKIVNPLHQYSEFKEKIETPLKNKRTKIAMSRLAVSALSRLCFVSCSPVRRSQVVLKAVMLRRIKTMTVDGKPLLLLPKREIIEVKGPFLDA